ncbi:MAG: hypothetical protein ABSE51_06340 [Terracidiphilus sp.]|jgi:hypothetical protein
MPFFKNFLGKPEQQIETYWDGFYDLVEKFKLSFDLDDWKSGLPKYYSSAEQKGINQTNARLKYAAGCPEVAEPLQRLVGEIGLISTARELKDALSDNMDESEEDFQTGCIVSTYLKAWLCNSSPFILLELASFLFDKNYIDEARDAVDVSLQFPSYARTHKLDEMAIVAQSLVWELFLPGMHSESHVRSQGIYDNASISLLLDKAKEITGSSSQ